MPDWPFLGVNGAELIVGCNQDVGKDRFESPFLVLIVEHYDGSDPQGMPARTACRHFTLQILQKPVGKVILIVCPPRCFHSRFPAIRTVVLHIIFLRIPVQRSSARVTNPDSFFRMKTHDNYLFFWQAAGTQQYTRPDIYLMLEEVKTVHRPLDSVTRLFAAV